jgi:hypothetical protein
MRDAMSGAIWDELAAEHPRELVESIRKRIELGESFDLLAAQFVANSSYRPEQGQKLLENFVTRGLLTKTVQKVCRCGQILTDAEAAGEICPHCEQAFVDIGAPEIRTFYSHSGTRRRDVRWALALHGMNTGGAWQEELNWLISRTYGRSVPVAIYKYGVVRPGAILKFRLRALTRQLAARIKRLSGQTEQSGFGGVPDVLAHSLGTWLLGHALKEDSTLRVGRVILTGCILRPDFDWASLIATRQVEAVLCHFGTKDFWARVAQYVIPDSGPSGRRGFNDRTGVLHFKSPGVRHSDFFLERRMPTFYREVWQQFLTSPGPEPLQAEEPLGKAWRPTFWILRATLFRWAIVLIMLIALLLAVAIFAAGGIMLYGILKTF